MELEPSYSPLRAFFGSRRVRGYGACIAIAVAVTAWLTWELNQSDSRTLRFLRESGFLPTDFFSILAFGFGLMFAVGAGIRWLRSGHVLQERCAEVEGVRFVKAPWGGAVSARFQVEGALVVAMRRTVTVHFDSPQVATFTRRQLRALGRDPSSAPSYASAARAASELAWANVLELRIERDRIVIRGRSGQVKDLVRHALALAQAPQALGLVANQHDHQLGCPYCHEALSDVLNNPTVRCSGCDSLSHVECWKEHGGCAVFACSKTPQSRGRTPERARAPSTPLKG